MILALICRQNLLGNLCDVINNNNSNLISLCVEIMETTTDTNTYDRYSSICVQQMLMRWTVMMQCATSD